MKNESKEAGRLRPLVGIPERAGAFQGLPVERVDISQLLLEEINRFSMGPVASVHFQLQSWIEAEHDRTCSFGIRVQFAPSPTT